ncbi:SulP family inorganic anion transporter [Phenylobacterium montanum]|uniref:SulP family inorganic anion transporter n=1 Tax=Phenylobacterium montanum TaxID=2823693 RepID=A0A975IX24_9CAUL|nr:SulP family inorganic anion transporter [Caulobacter sp. S6]QUD90450.1 SulP family inorganic anion transporter [Caulobacter sp. S6]
MQSPKARPAWPVFQALQGVTMAELGGDLIAGATLAAIAIPEQIATAQLGGLPPQLGFFAFIVAGLGFAAFGSSRRLSAGADSTITPIFAGSLAGMASVGSAHYLALAAALALLVGLILVLAGAFKMDWIADLLSRPVITGFLAGISIHIVISQAPAILGLSEGSGDVYHRLARLWAEAGGVNPAAVAIGLGVFATILLGERVSARIPSALAALVAATLACGALGADRLGVRLLGAVPAGVPAPALPAIVFDDLPRLFGLAVLIALVVMMQTAVTSRSFAGEDGDPDIGRDYVGLGVANALSGLAGAFPVNASPPRTAAVAESGGRSQVAGLTAVLAVLLLAAFGTKVLAAIPVAALGGVLLFVAQRIFHVGELRELWGRTRAEFGLALLTMALIAALPIQTGVAIGVFLSLAHGVFTVTRAQPIPFERMPGSTVWWPASPHATGETETGVLVTGFQAPLSFLNAHDFRRGLLSAIEEGRGRLRLVVLEASSVVEIDFTASAALIEVIGKARAAGMDFAVARLESVRARAAFDRLGIAEALGADHIFPSVEQAIRTLARD